MKKVYFLCASLLFIFEAYSQDQNLVNPNQSLISTNPSFAGSNGSLRNQFVYRNMWPALSGNSISYYNGLDAYVKKLHGGLAISGIITDQAHGTYRNSEINLVYAPQFECKKIGLKIIPSLQLTYRRLQVDISTLTFGSLTQLGTATIPYPGTKSNFDGSAGLLFSYKNFYAGGTVFHINKPDVGMLGVSQLPRRYSFNASYNVPLNEKTLLNFSAVYNKQNTFNNLQLSANAVFLKHIIAGLGYMSGDAVFLNLGYRNNFFSITTGYDFVYSKLAGNSTGSWQLGMGLSLRKKTAGQIPSNFENW